TEGGRGLAGVGAGVPLVAGARRPERHGGLDADRLAEDADHVEQLAPLAAADVVDLADRPAGEGTDGAFDGVRDVGAGAGLAAVPEDRDRLAVEHRLDETGGRPLLSAE